MKLRIIVKVKISDQLIMKDQYIACSSPMKTYKIQ